MFSNEFKFRNWKGTLTWLRQPAAIPPSYKKKEIHVDLWKNFVLFGVSPGQQVHDNRSVCTDPEVKGQMVKVAWLVSALTAWVLHLKEVDILDVSLCLLRFVVLTAHFVGLCFFTVENWKQVTRRTSEASAAKPGCIVYAVENPYIYGSYFMASSPYFNRSGSVIVYVSIRKSTE